MTALLMALALPASAQTIAITGGRVLPVSGPAIENGTVLIRDGKIAAVGANVAIPAGAQRIDATGKVVTPGLVNASSQLGITEIGAVAGTREVQATGRQNVAAAFSVWEGLNPASALLAPARAGGVTTAIILPGGGLVSGQAAALHLVGGTTATDMIMRRAVAMVGNVANPGAAGAANRGELLLRVRELLTDVRAYQQRRADYERAQTRTFVASRLDLEAMAPVLAGRMPLVVEVDKASDIDAALLLARDFGLKLIIGGAAEAWMVADKLAAARVPVLTGAMNNIPQTFSTLGTRQENAGLLRRAGVQVAIIGNAGGGDENAFNARNIRFEAGNAVAYGMSWDDALRAVTLTPAEIFGVADRVGSLSPGKDADLVIWSGDPFEFATHPERVFVQGREFRDPTRQDMLESRYKALPPDYRRPPQ
jgi:imidazolonepropionase-like amidohydrolase